MWNPVLPAHAYAWQLVQFVHFVKCGFCGNYYLVHCSVKGEPDILASGPGPLVILIIGGSR